MQRDGLTVPDILWILEMRDFIEKKNHNKFHFSAIGSKNFLVPLQFHVLLSLQPRGKFDKLILASVHPCKALRWSSGRKNSKRLEVTGTVRFGKIFLNTWASKTYKDISKKQHRQVLRT